MFQSLPTPCIKGQFGPHLLAFQTQVTAEGLLNVLGHNPQSKFRKALQLTNPQIAEIYDTIQRTTTQGRLKGLSQYLHGRLIARRAVAAFPALCVGMTQVPRFRPIPEAPPEAVILDIDLANENIRVLLDGLGRESGMLEFLNPSDGRARPDVTVTMPVTIFAPSAEKGALSIQELHQLFADFNFRGQKCSADQASAGDMDDLYGQVTKRIGSSNPLAAYGGIFNKKKAGKGADGFILRTDLLRFVRGACEGATFQKSNNAVIDDPNLTEETADQICGKICDYLTLLKVHMGERFGDKRSAHLDNTGLQALGLIFNDLYLRAKGVGEADIQDVVREVAGLDWSRDNQALIDLEIIRPHGKKGRLGQDGVSKLRTYIHDTTSLGNRLRAAA